MSIQQSVFQGVWVPLVTPFSGGAVDGGALRRLVRHYASAGVDGLVVCGSTGEAASLDDAEQLAVLDAVLTEAGRLPVIMGLAGNHQGHVLQRLSAFGTRPLAGILAPAPYYVRAGQEGAAAYFRRLADASRFPLVLYDIPYRTGTTLDTSTLLSLAAHPNVAAIKDCGGSLDKTLALIADGQMNVLAGEDLQTLSVLCLGGAGMIAAAAHLRPDLFVAMYRAVRNQQLDQARRLFHALAPVIRLAFEEPNPGPLKAQLGRQGLLTEELRQPMPTASAALAARLDAAVAGLNRQYPQP
ncbi:4-hydroxy-tetrahydrodipicolinate synthase [Achromobacter piechaudii]|uniref:4-hydroxy-tetrahydrodipicolinate synthase n=1 Tax=Achromobacter piechaudii TaxID=72556 RepID=A0A6S7CBT4_9BURK|nr:4-hydroxy-tetrahydrodipicolinate synthase [Achromobacter piechaudii]KNY11415.1 dihydrodipicolinate synthase [Achromobacter piechaudii]CAB3665629.1 4-hydroxy-tetrahydrodipicolinate synthase [Achromobacter piechaudii]CAB3829876.1 4-hydroxy-tetrahydrodipicolinate synthase [Achromobacter piechaudii]CAB3841950.1 4-hydroxy-tetrahydrodipicolinate synthase [Achromobacter piechaudii]CAB3944241.1 4-hydroxy-tetrahydrodipicolinate synthase [Achromobacter piechaudii]